jgi:hypothetical protein
VKKKENKNETDKKRSKKGDAHERCTAKKKQQRKNGGESRSMKEWQRDMVGRRRCNEALRWASEILMLGQAKQ